MQVSVCQCLLPFILRFSKKVYPGVKKKHVKERMTQAVSLLNASLQSTTDGILIVNRQGSIVTWNQKFLELWNLSDASVSSRDDSAVISSILSQLTYPDRFLSKVQELYTNPEATSFDVIEFLD